MFGDLIDLDFLAGLAELGLDPDMLADIDWDALAAGWDEMPAGASVDDLGPSTFDLSDFAAVDDLGPSDFDPAPSAVDDLGPSGRSTGNTAAGGSSGTSPSGLQRLMSGLGSALGGGGGAPGAGGGGASLGMFGAVQPQGLPVPAIPAGGGAIGGSMVPIQSGGAMPAIQAVGAMPAIRQGDIPDVGGGGVMEAPPFSPFAALPMAQAMAPARPSPLELAPFTPIASAVPLPSGPVPSGLQRLLMGVR